jgi:hypothetical protein
MIKKRRMYKKTGRFKISVQELEARMTPKVAVGREAT